MYRNFWPEGLSISGRKSELIELVLTHKLKRLTINPDEFQNPSDTNAVKQTAQFYKSARLKMAPFQLPVRWSGEGAVFKHDFEKITPLLETLKDLDCQVCTVMVAAGGELPYHENFEHHRERLLQFAEMLEQYEMRLGLDFRAPAYHRGEHPYSFVSSPEAIVALVKMCDSNSVGAVVDWWHWRVGGGTIDQVRQLSVDEIVEVRLADIPEGTDLENATEESRALPGTVDPAQSAELMQHLRDIEYLGPVTACSHESQHGGRKRDEIVILTAETLAEFITPTEVEEVEEDAVETAEA